MALDLKRMEAVQEERKLASQTELTLLSRMPFGKHKGLTVSEVLEDDPGYIIWMNDNIDRYRFAEGIVEHAGRAQRHSRTTPDFGEDFDDLMDVPF